MSHRVQNIEKGRLFHPKVASEVFTLYVSNLQLGNPQVCTQHSHVSEFSRPVSHHEDYHKCCRVHTGRENKKKPKKHHRRRSGRGGRLQNCKACNTRLHEESFKERHEASRREGKRRRQWAHRATGAAVRIDRNRRALLSSVRRHGRVAQGRAAQGPRRKDNLSPA